MMDDRDQSSTLLAGRFDDNAPLSQWCSLLLVMLVKFEVTVRQVAMLNLSVER